MIAETHPLDRVQAGYLLVKLRGDGLINDDETRKALAVLFPDLLPVQENAPLSS